MIRCSIWTLPFDKIRFSQLNTASAGIVPHCCFFSARTEEMPEVIALNYILIALHFSAKLCILAFQIRCAELAANGFVLGKLLFQTGDLCLEPCNQPIRRIQSLLQFGFLFSAATYFFASVDRCSKSSRSTAILVEKGMGFDSIFSIAATATC